MKKNRKQFKREKRTQRKKNELKRKNAKILKKTDLLRDYHLSKQLLRKIVTGSEKVRKKCDKILFKIDEDKQVSRYNHDTGFLENGTAIFYLPDRSSLDPKNEGTKK